MLQSRQGCKFFATSTVTTGMLDPSEHAAAYSLRSLLLCPSHQPAPHLLLACLVQVVYGAQKVKCWHNVVDDCCVHGALCFPSHNGILKIAHPTLQCTKQHP